jgi:hypothetical protein
MNKKQIFEISSLIRMCVCVCLNYLIFKFIKTPIMFAVQKDRDDFCRLLLENGANPNIFTLVIL